MPRKPRADSCSPTNASRNAHGCTRLIFFIRIIPPPSIPPPRICIDVLKKTRHRRLRRCSIGGHSRRSPNRDHRRHCRIQLLPPRSPLCDHRRFVLSYRVGEYHWTIHGMDPGDHRHHQDLLRHTRVQHGPGGYLQRAVRDVRDEG
jgi:hypothetical protein